MLFKCGAKATGHYKQVLIWNEEENWGSKLKKKMSNSRVWFRDYCTLYTAMPWPMIESRFCYFLLHLLFDNFIMDQLNIHLLWKQHYDLQCLSFSLSPTSCIHISMLLVRELKPDDIVDSINTISSNIQRVVAKFCIFWYCAC